MACLLEIKLNASDFIALLALIVAGISALYSYRSWLEASKANRISLSDQKIEIYKSFFNLKMHMAQYGEYAEMSEVSRFYYPSRNAKIYLPSGLSNDIEKYFDACFLIADIRQKYGKVSKESSDECQQHTATEQNLVVKIDNEFMAILKEVHT